MAKINILLMIKDEFNKRSFELYLRKKGIQDDFFFIDGEQENTEQNILKKTIYDLIIIDSKKWELTVPELVAKFRQREGGNFFSDIPIIIATEKSVTLDKVFVIDDILNFSQLEKLIEQLVVPSIDMSYLYELADVGMPEPEVLINKLATTFKELVPEKLSEIEKLLQVHNFDGVSKIAHSLRSIAGNVGAHLFAESLRQLEEGSRKGLIQLNDQSHGSYEQYWPMKLEHEFQKAQSSLVKIIDDKSYLVM